MHPDSKTANTSNNTYDVVYVGDSFGSPTYGLSNGIARIGNLSVICFWPDNETTGSIERPYVFIAHLISSGFVHSYNTRFIVLETAGKSDFLEYYNSSTSPGDRIAYDIPSFILWTKFGSTIDDIARGLNPKTKIFLTDFPSALQSHDTIEKTDIRQIPYHDEPAFSVPALPGRRSDITVSGIMIPPESTMFMKITGEHGNTGSVPAAIIGRAGEKDCSVLPNTQSPFNNITVKIFTEYDNRSYEIFSEVISAEEINRLVTLSLDKYAGKVVDLRFSTSSDDTYAISDEKVYFINPTIVSNSQDMPALYQPYSIGNSINFSDAGNSYLYTTYGWSHQEGMNRWTDGKEASLNLYINNTTEPLYLNINATAFTSPTLEQQRAIIKVNNKTLPESVTLNNYFQTLSILIPPGYIEKGNNTISFALPDATSPKKLDISKDKRILGIWVNTISVSGFPVQVSQPVLKQISILAEKWYLKLDYLMHTPKLSLIWDKNQTQSVFRVRDTILNTLKNQFDIPIPATSKARLSTRIQSSNVEFDTIYYNPDADKNNKLYTSEKLVAANNNLNCLSEQLKEYNISLFVVIPPDSSEIYNEFFIHRPEFNASQKYEDLRAITKTYTYIDAEKIIKDRVHAKELDLYPIFTRHWSPKSGFYVAEETVKKMNNITKAV